MYMSVKKYKSKKSESTTYYFYLCKSQRVDGKVKTQQNYICNISPDYFLVCDNALLRNQILLNILSLNRKNKINITNEEFNTTWEKFIPKINKIRKEEMNNYNQQYGKYSNYNNYNYNSYSESSNNNNYNYNSYSGYSSSSNNNNCTYTEEEKKLFKEMFKDMAKRFHPDISGDDGSKMKLLLKIKENIL